MTQACVSCQGHTIRGHDGTLSAVVSHPTRPNGLVTPGECQLARPRRLGGMMFLLWALVSTLFLSPQHKKKKKSIWLIKRDPIPSTERRPTIHPTVGLGGLSVTNHLACSGRSGEGTCLLPSPQFEMFTALDAQHEGTWGRGRGCPMK